MISQQSSDSGPPQAEFDPGRPAASYVRVAIAVIQNPKLFYDNMPRRSGYQAPALFTLISFIIPGLAVTLIKQEPLALLLYLLLIGGWLIYVALLHLVATKFMAGQADFQGTFRAIAYTSFTSLIVFIPYLGLAAHLFGFYLAIYGLSSVHRLSIGQAALTLGVVIIFLILINLMMAGSLVQQMS